MVEAFMASEKTAETSAEGETPVAFCAGETPLTVGAVASRTVLGAENSEVSPSEVETSVTTWAVAVAVTLCPAANLLAGEKVKAALPEASVERSAEPTKVLPSSPEGLE